MFRSLFIYYEGGALTTCVKQQHVEKTLHIMFSRVPFMITIFSIRIFLQSLAHVTCPIWVHKTVQLA